MKDTTSFEDVAAVFRWLGNMAAASHKCAVRAGMPFGIFERLGTEAGRWTLAEMIGCAHADYLRERRELTCLPQDHYRVYVPSYDSLPPQHLLEERWGMGNVSSALFQGHQWHHSSCEDMDRMPGEKVCYLHDPGCEWGSKEMIRWGLEQRSQVAPKGYRPATREEAVAVATARLYLADFVALGSGAPSEEGNPQVTHVRQVGARRFLDVGNYFDAWNAGTRALFVVK